MVRAAEETSATNPVAERRFDSRVIFAFVAGAILLLLLFAYVGNRIFFDETDKTEQKSTRTQESDKRAAP